MVKRLAIRICKDRAVMRSLLMSKIVVFEFINKFIASFLTNSFQPTIIPPSHTNNPLIPTITSLPINKTLVPSAHSHLIVDSCVQFYERIQSIRIVPILYFIISMAQINIQGNPMQEEHDRLNGKPKHIVLPQSDENHSETPFYGNCMHCWGTCCGCMRTWAPCICCCFVDYPYKIVPQSYAGIYQKFGRYVRTVTPGLHYINPCTETLGMISLKINVLDLARQNIITKDNVSINIDAAVYFRVVNPRYAYYRVQNFNVAIAEVTYAILKNTCGQFILQDLLEKRQEIADDIEKQVDQYVIEWGVDIEEIFIKDIQLSKDLQDSLSSAAKERRLAESKIISAKADVESAKLMRMAAEELNSKAAMQIRYLQTLKQVGRSNTKVIFIPQMKNKQRINHLITQGMIN